MIRSSCSITEEESQKDSLWGSKEVKGKTRTKGEKLKYQRRMNAKGYFGNGESSH